MESSGFFSLVAGTLFLAVCAYGGAALYRQVEQPEIVMVQRTHLRESAELEGIVLREEQSLCFDRGTRPLALDVERLAAGQILALDASGQELLSQQAGIYFSETDGFEGLDAGSFDAGDVSALEELLAERPVKGGEGRLVTGCAWYYWALCSDKQALPDSGACRIEFEGMGESVPARIISLSLPENGRQAVLLRLNQGGSEYLKLRKTGAKLLFSEHSGLVLPEEAIHQAADGSKFVYTLSAGALERRTVEITYTGDGFSLAAFSAAPEALREGDRVVIGKEISQESQRERAGFHEYR